MTKKRRRSFLLIETITASALVLLTVLACFSFFFFVWKASLRQQADLEKESLRWRRISSLQWTLSRIKRDHKNEDPFVIDGNEGRNPRLVFVFDHGVHINPKLANNDLAQLYIDHQKGLVLVTRSHPKRAGVGQEEEVASIIWPGATEIKWRFALRPRDKEEKVGADLSEDHWTTTWRADWTGLPAAIQAIVTDEEGAVSVVTAVILQDLGEITLK
jgi:hypothetical protein